VNESGVIALGAAQGRVGTVEIDSWVRALGASGLRPASSRTLIGTRKIETKKALMP